MVKVILSKRKLDNIKKKHIIYTSYKEIFPEEYKNPLLSFIKNNLVYHSNCISLFDIYTTRFDSYTYLENFRYKNNMDFNGSLYGTTLKLPSKVSLEKYVFVLDMNNTINKIMGIGLIKNIISKEQNIKIYKNQAFNNFIYKSNYYLPLIDIQNNNQYYENIKPEWKKYIIDEFESILFYGKTHLKRGGPFMQFPIKKIKTNHFKFLLTLFILLNPNDFNNKIFKKLLIKMNY